MVQESYLLQHGLLAADDDRHLAFEDDVDLLEWRRVRPGAAAGQELREADPLVVRAAGLEALQAERRRRRGGWAPS